MNLLRTACLILVLSVPAVACAAEEHTFQDLEHIWMAIGLVVLFWMSGLALTALNVWAVALRPGFVRKASQAARNSPVRCGLLGIAALLVLAALLASLGKVHALRFLLAGAGIIGLWLAIMVSSAIIGESALFGINSPKSGLMPWNVLVGGVLLTLTATLPVVGWLVALLAIVAGAGGVLAAPFTPREINAPQPQKPASHEDL